MVDQPNHKSYKIRGHSRQRRSSKPYYRPSEAKNKGLLDKVKDYLSPSWLFGYFTSKEDEYVSPDVEEDASNEYATVTHEEGSTSSSYAPNQGRLDSVEEESDGDAFESSEKDNDRTISDDRTDKQAQVFDENTTRPERVANPDLSVRLSGSLEDDIEDENERRATLQSDKPQQSVLSYATDQLTRKPLPSLLSSRPMSSSLLLQRGTPSARSNRNPLLGSLSARSTGSTYTPSVKFSTPMTSSGVGLSSTQKHSSSETRPSILSMRSSSLRDSSVTSSQRSSVDATPGFSSTSTKTTTSQSIPPTKSGPLFSVEKFVRPVQRTFTNKRVGSPNYPGPVTYGGAMTVSRDVPFKRRRTTSPGSESYHPVSRLRIRGVKEKTVQNLTHGGSGTRTAQRILDALESVSSPLKDVHRIPSPISVASASPLAFKPSKFRTTPPKTRVGPRVSYLQAKLLGDPPVSSLQTPDVARVSFVDDATSTEDGPSSPPSSPPRKTSTRPVQDHSFFSGLKDTVLKSSLPTTFAPRSLPTSLSPIENSGKTSGKVKTASRTAPMHYCHQKTKQDDEVVNPLPEIRNAVPLSLDPDKKMSLPMFSANKKANDDSKLEENSLNKQESSTKDKLLKESPRNGFIFSTPAPKTQRFSEREDSDAAADKASFSFSDPVPMRKTSDATKETFTNPLLQSQGSLNSFQPTVNVPVKESGKNNSSSKSPLTNDISFGSNKTPPTESLGRPEPTQTNDFAQRFAPVAGSWECTSCMLNNKATATKCVACETAKPSVGKTGSDKQEIDLKAKFAAPKDSWECATCMVRNKNELTKCAACETIRPGSSQNDNLKLKFAAPSGSWECPTCMIQNKAADLKCVACQTSKPGSSSNDSLKLKFAAPSGSWECPTCMIQNKSGDLKCVACQTSKPGAESSGQNQTGFSFGTTNAPSSGFTFGGNGASKSSTTSGFTFGNSDSKDATDASKPSTFTFGQSSSEAKKPNFSFGNSTAAATTASGDTKPASGFTFGGGAGETAAAVPPFTFGGGSSKGENRPQFSFGAGKTESTPSQSVQTVSDNKKPSEELSTAPAMNIAQAAAAGLLKVPGKETPTQIPAQPSVNVPAQPSAKVPAQPLAQTATNSTVPTFAFGATSTSTVPAEQKTSTETPSAAFTALPSTTAQVKPFAFQGSTTSAVGSTTGGLFTFGAQQSSAVSTASSSAAKPNSTGLFSFTGSTPGNTVTSSGSANTPSFSFAPSNTAAPLPAAATTAATLPTTSSAPLFNFTGSAGPSVKTTLPSSESSQPSLFNFSGSTTTAQVKPPAVFNFGGAVNGPTSSNGPSVTAEQTGNTLFSFTGAQQSSTAPVVENQNSMGGEDMDADSNNNHDQTTFPQATGGFNFAAQATGNTSGIFSGGTNATPGSTPGGFNFAPNAGVAPTFQFGSNQNTPSGGFNFGAPTAGSSPFIFGGASTPAGGTSSPSTAQATTFNFGGSSVGSKRGVNVAGPTNDQPSMFNIGAGQTSTPSNRVYRKAVRRKR